ncbi:MAG TPA: efflux RND transporter periplasmic adaptor subunit [Terriglobales bacterium]|nr:efflux RND transporter periplasmic adaptor subunit [Terriglobales bacterium]
MDIPRQNAARERRRRQIIIGAIGIALILLITLGVSRLKPAAPSVERSTVWVDTVKRGPMLRQVRGLGTLVPTDIRWLPAATEGRVERLLIQPGTKVKASDVILEMSNPQITQAALDAEWQMKAAEAEYQNLAVQLRSQVLAQKSEWAKVQSEYSAAKMQADTDAELAKLGVISTNALKVSTGKATELNTRTEIEQQRLTNSGETLKAQLEAQKAKVEQARAMYHLRREQLEALRLRAGTDGVLQDLPLKEGQWVTPGTTLARVVQPERLKAELRVPETQAKDIALGLPAQIDTRNGIVQGKVMRIDPAVVNGTVTVDVQLEGQLPQGARPDLSVDGTIDLENLKNVMFVGRPAFGQEKSTVEIFKLEADGKTASRVKVDLGRSSVNTVEIVKGLNEGDQVILSDMSRWDKYDRIRLE